MRLKVLFLTALFSMVALAAHGDGNMGTQNAVMFMIDKEPGHPRKRNTIYANEIAEAVDRAAAEYKHDPYLLISMAHWESRFRPDVLSLKKKGPAKEKGLLQCGRDCAANCPHFMDTIEGQALCGANWLAEARAVCPDSIRETLTYYACGTACKAKNYKPSWCLDREDPKACYKREQANLKAKVTRRLSLAKKLRSRFASN
jgi:hypothetical protein